MYLFCISCKEIVATIKVPTLVLATSSGSKKKEPRCTCLIETKASHSQRMWAEVSSCTPHVLHEGLLVSPVKWRCLIRVLCPVRRPVMTLGMCPSKGLNLIFALRLWPEVNSWAILWVLPRPCLLAQCWLSNHRFVCLLKFCLETRKTACPGTQYSPTVCRVETSFNVFWHCPANGDVVLAFRRAFRAVSKAFADTFCND